MSDKLREAVSAAMDGEAGDLELRRLLAAADQPDVRAAWQDFHLQRDAAAGVDLRFAGIDLTRRVQAALAGDVAPAASTERSAGRGWRSVAGFAVAASVAAVVAVGMRQGLDTEAPAAGMAESRPATAGKVFPAAAEAGGQVPVSAPVEPVSAERDASAPDQALAPEALDPTLSRPDAR